MPVLERTMKTMRLADDVVTFSTFRKTMAECFNRNTKSGRPLLITQNGVASKVVIDVADFDNIRETLELMRSRKSWGYDPLVQTREIAPHAVRPIHRAGKR